MNSKEEQIISILKRIIDENGKEVFNNSKRVEKLVEEYFADSQLRDEKQLLKRMIHSERMKYIALDDKSQYSIARKKAFYGLVEREFIDHTWAEKVLGWFDVALGYIDTSNNDELDFIQQFNNESKKTNENGNGISAAELLSPIDMLLDEDNNDHIILFNEDNQQIEFEQIALVPISGKTYAILKPVLDMPGIANDEALVFAIDEVGDEESLVIVENADVIDAVFEEYYYMLRTDEVDID